MKYLLTERFVLNLIAVTVLLLIFYIALIYKPAKNMVILCEEGHTKLLLKIQTASSTEELGRIELLVDDFDERYQGHLPKEKVNRLTCSLYDAIYQRNEQLKRTSKK